MKSILTAAAVAVVLSAGSALAWEGKTVACFDKQWVGPAYKAHNVLVKPAKEKYEHKNGRVELVRYAAVYREHRSQVSEGKWIMKQVSCGCPACN